MMTRESGKKREQIQLMSLDDLVPQDHLVRKLEAALDWNFIYELVEEKCSEDSGRPSIDPVVLIKLPVIQYMFGLRSMRQTIREAEVNTAYRVQTACDAKGIILGYSVHPGNENDGRTFPEVLEKLGHLPVEIVVGDTAYKTPAIAHLLKSKGIKLLSTYGRPKTKKDSSQSMSMSMMSTTTAISVPTTSFCITPPRTGTVTGNTGAAAQSLQAVPILHSVPTARSTSRP